MKAITPIPHNPIPIKRPIHLVSGPNMRKMFLTNVSYFVNLMSLTVLYMRLTWRLTPITCIIGVICANVTIKRRISLVCEFNIRKKFLGGVRYFINLTALTILYMKLTRRLISIAPPIGVICVHGTLVCLPHLIYTVINFTRPPRLVPMVPLSFFETFILSPYGFFTRLN